MTGPDVLRREGVLVLTALRFLTRLPVPDPGWEPGRLGASARWFPLAGAVAGALAGAVFWALAGVLPGALAAGLALGVLVWVTGALHEDGLADFADGAGAAVPRERALEIMRDSRIGGFGAVALVFGIGLRWAALAALAGDPMAGLGAMAAAAAAARVGVLAVAAMLPPARPGGLGAELAGGPGALALGVGLGTALAVALVAAGAAGVAALAAALAASAVVARIAARRIGGYTGDVFGAVVVAGEVAALAVLAGVLA